nr:hypothetical protein [Marinicella sp. W31]MDC2880036.1 hypothetical protein [Marinicella sp. W31]
MPQRASGMRQSTDLSVYLVLDPGLCAGIEMVETARRAVAGGATTAQLRNKTGGRAATGRIRLLGVRGPPRIVCRATRKSVAANLRQRGD